MYLQVIKKLMLILDYCIKKTLEQKVIKVNKQNSGHEF